MHLHKYSKSQAIEFTQVTLTKVKTIKTKNLNPDINTC